MNSTRNTWLKVGCFLIGYNYNILKGCSELSVKRVIRYTSALLIICLLWTFIGYEFTSRYLKGEWYSSILGGVIMIVIVIQVERQVILSNKGNTTPFVFRGIIALLMGLIGSIIVDQIIFKEDVERHKEFLMAEKVNRIFPAKAAELRRQIEEINMVIQLKENEYKIIMEDINKHPTHQVRERVRNVKHASTDSARVENTITTREVPNPKIDLLPAIDQRTAVLRVEKGKKDNELLALRPQVEEDLRKHTGFLDELDTMLSIIKHSGVAMATWCIWFFLLLGLELFILVSKLKEPETDYDLVIQQQMDLHIKRLKLLTQKIETI